jgi:HTH-type transcriptional regulator/antitoxin HigA
MKKPLNGYNAKGNPLPGIPIPPGEQLADELQERGLTQSAFAKIIGRPLNTVNEIIKGKKSITAESAIAFEQALGIRAEIWLNLEASYQLTKARIAVRQAKKTSRPKKAIA